jgi:DNA-directed RNA polymerase subunit M/transcription elongation factor TFIIS
MTSLRLLSLEKFNNILNNNTLSTEIEKSIYNSCISESNNKGIQKKWENSIFRGLYNDKIMHILINLDAKSYINNKNFLKNVLDGNIEIQNIPKMNPIEIYPEKWQSIIDKFDKQEKIAEESKNLATTDMFKCPKCKKNKATYYKMQIRSADEPETTFITCSLCKHNWRMN